MLKFALGIGVGWVAAKFHVIYEFVQDNPDSPKAAEIREKQAELAESWRQFCKNTKQARSKAKTDQAFERIVNNPANRKDE
jgi:hypothetical protein